MATPTTQAKVVTPIFRTSFCKIFKAGKSEDGKDVYSVVAIFDKDADLKPLQKIVDAAKKAKWGDKPVANFKSPFRKGTSDEYDLTRYPEYKGKIICSFRSYERKPGIIGPDKQEIIDPNDFYSGCFARAAVTAYAYDSKGNKGVSLGLSSLMKVKDGEPLSAISGNASEDFSGIAAVDNSSEFDDDDDESEDEDEAAKSKAKAKAKAKTKAKPEPEDDDDEDLDADDDDDDLGDF